MKSSELNLEDMKQGIAKAGGLFYQYRPCRRDTATIKKYQRGVSNYGRRTSCF